MAATSSEEQKAKENAHRKSRNARDPLEKLRYMIISNEGTSGISKFSKLIQTFDEDGNKEIDFKEFLRGCTGVGLRIDRDESRAMFERLDRDKSGRIDYYEFLENLRPEMSRHRRDTVDRAFRRMDRTRSGYITARDLLYYYDVKNHPDYQSGRYSRDELEDRLLRDLGLEGWNREVTRQDFINYFAGISFAVENDRDFDKMIGGSFKV